MLAGANIGRMPKPGPTQIPDEIWDDAIARLRRALDEKKTTQKALAKAIGISGPSISAWFKPGGNRGTPANLAKALRAVGEDAAQVMGTPGGWEGAAKAAGFDPDHPVVREVYQRQFRMAMEYAEQTIRAMGPLGPAETSEIRTA